MYSGDYNERQSCRQKRESLKPKVTLFCVITGPDSAADMRRPSLLWLTTHMHLYICIAMQLTTLHTLADQSRVQIVEALLEGEQAVNDLVSKMEIHQSGVSRHLRILEEAGFVRMRPDGPGACTHCGPSRSAS